MLRLSDGEKVRHIWRVVRRMRVWLTYGFYPIYVVIVVIKLMKSLYLIACIFTPLRCCVNAVDR